jgi:hypothetical protein
MPKLRIAACARAPVLLFIYQRIVEIFKKKIMVAQEVVVNCYIFIPTSDFQAQTPI